MPSIFSHPDVRVMTYNVKNGGDIPHWEHRKSRLAGVIREQRPTLLGTQEGFEFQLAYLRDNLKHFDVIGEGRIPLIGDEYCAIFVDRRVVEVQKTGTFWLSETPAVAGSRMADDNLPRIATWAKMAVQGTPLLYINTHLTHVKENIPAQMSVLVEEIEKLIDPAVETVITGDFNIGRHLEPIAQLQAIGFQDVWTLASSVCGPTFTFPDWNVWDDDAEIAIPNENRIDWICARPPDGESTPLLNVKTVQTHHFHPTPSDHFPVVVSAAGEAI